MRYILLTLSLSLLFIGCSSEKITDQAASSQMQEVDVQDVETQNIVRLQTMYDEGIDKMQAGQKEEGLKDVMKAANEGLAQAQIMLGFFYNVGSDVPKDTQKAIALWEKAAAQNSAMGHTAFIYLGETYESGEDVPQDYSKAMYWYRKGADEGSPIEIQHLGSLYEHGHGTPVDLEKAAELYRKAADSGNADAQTSLAFMYFKGEGVPQNYLQAKDYAQKAALQGNGRAQFLSGTLHIGVPSIPIDYVAAYAWYSLAKAGGIEDANGLLVELA